VRVAREHARRAVPGQLHHRVIVVPLVDHPAQRRVSQGVEGHVPRRDAGAAEDVPGAVYPSSVTEFVKT
jgi:hypothetical protein